MANYTHKYRVYVETVKGGRTYGSYLPEEYDKAEAHFNKLVANGNEAVHLQELSLEYGWVINTLKKHITEEFKARKEAYWEKLREEEEKYGWRPGDPVWEAPGMSVSDFF